MDISFITYEIFIPLLNTIHDLTKGVGLVSFGWAIVFLTAAVKLILTPLTFKQIKSTRKMQLVQPKLKKLQDDFKKKEEKLKDKPDQLSKERMAFQQEMMGFYKENDINPLGGCLPLIVQMPILLGLFWTFSGAPFKEKPLYVDVKVVAQEQADKKKIKPYKNGEIYVDADGNRARISLSAKKVVMLEGESITISPSRVMGDAAIDFEEIHWKFFGGKDSDEHVQIVDNPDGTATITANKVGSTKVEADLPQALKDDSFLFIKDFGTTGVFNKETGSLNIDVLILVLLFGFSIWLSSRLNAPKTPDLKPGEAEDPQAAMQKSMATMMPVMMTGMMFFIPLPAGAFLYMIVSSFIQAGQTFFAMKRYDKKFAQ